VSKRTRTLHAIDIECLAGRAHRLASALLAATQAYKAEIEIGPTDLVVVSCDRTPVQRLEVGLLWPGAQRVFGHGRNGADLALIEAIDVAWAAARFTDAVIASGDGIFADLAGRLRALGLHVTVAAPEASLSRRLVEAADTIRLLRRCRAVTPERLMATV